MSVGFYLPSISQLSEIDNVMEANHKVIHIISSLNQGGAEMMLFKLLSLQGVREDVFEHIVVSMQAGGELHGRVQGLGVPVYSLGIDRNFWSLAVGFFRLINLLRIEKPRIVQGWMYHGCAFALIAKLALRRVKIIWNIRHSLHNLRSEKRLTLSLIYALASLSRIPSNIIYNSNVSAAQHKKIGYSKSFARVIPNGFDCSLFKPRNDAKKWLHRELDVPDGIRLVGVVGRYHSVKGHLNFIAAASTVIGACDDLELVCVGENIDWSNKELKRAIVKAGLSQKIHLLGPRDDIPIIMSGLDFLCSPSSSEAFPNVVGEAMAAGTPCIVTDVGDSAYVVGPFGFTCQAENPKALAGSMIEILNKNQLELDVLKSGSRNRIESQFSIESVSSQYESIYHRLSDL